MNEDADNAPLAHLIGHIGENYADSFGACREVLAAMFELDTPAPEDRAAYDMDFEIYDFGPMQVATCRSPASVLTRGPLTIARTGTNHFHAQVYRTNGFVMSLDGARIPVAAGEVCLLDLSRPVDIRTDGVDNLSIMILRDLLLPMIAEPADVHGLILHNGSEANVTVRMHLEDLLRQAPDLNQREGLEFARVTAGLLAAVIGATREHYVATRTELRRSQFRAMCRHIEQRIGDARLGPTDLIRQFHVTRATLYRMFEPYGGIRKYLLSRRLTGVFRDLSDPDLVNEGVAVLLRRWGFANHTAAGRAFRSAYGITPSQARSLALSLEHINGHDASGVAARSRALKAAEDAFRPSGEMPAHIRAFAG